MIELSATPAKVPTGMPRITLHHSTLRAWEDRDQASLVESANNPKIWLHLHDAFPQPFTNSHAIQWLDSLRHMKPPPYLAIEVEGQARGGVGLHFQGDVYRRSAEIGYWLAEPYWSRGIMTEAVKAMVEYSFSTFDLCRIFAQIFAWNPASARVVEKAGFEFEGRLRKAVTKTNQTLDALLYSVVR